MHFTAIRFLLLGGFLLAPLHAIAQPHAEPYAQAFVITAYYSPESGQCCYVKGSEEADKILNGQGTHGADGTPVFPGMVAAPSIYPFGTRIAIPGLGVFTVHDRGGAIQTQEDGTHRLDVWAGSGEEGLARALAFGVRRRTGTVYLPGQSQPDARFTLESLPAPLERLEPFAVAYTSLMDVHPRRGHRGLSVSLLQESLKSAGYFAHAVTGFFGPVTEQAVDRFAVDMGVEPTEEISEELSAHLSAASSFSSTSHSVPFVSAQSSPDAVRSIQRLLRFLGYYRGRTHGRYDDNLFSAILVFQQYAKLVGSADSPGAGRIGPLTKARLEREWRTLLVQKKARQILARREVENMLAKRGDLLDRFLSEGNTGESVSRLQAILARKGLFPADRISGLFGEVTKKAVLRYQLARKVIESEKDQGAGTVGPQTLTALREDAVKAAFSVVRGYGWQAL